MIYRSLGLEVNKLTLYCAANLCHPLQLLTSECHITKKSQVQCHSEYYYIHNRYACLSYKTAGKITDQGQLL